VAKKKNKLDIRLVLIGIFSAMFVTFSVMCIPCLMAAYPSIGLFFAVLGALALLLSRYSWVFIVIGVLLISLGVLLQYLARKKTCR
jgi:hypothetical protein